MMKDIRNVLTHTNRDPYTHPSVSRLEREVSESKGRLLELRAKELHQARIMRHAEAQARLAKVSSGGGY
jgi:hypothetical protein